MKKLLALSLFALAPLCVAVFASALEPADSPAFTQAGAVETSGGAAVFDHNPSRGGVSAGGVRVSQADGCQDESCGFRKGGGAPASLKKEPKSPFVGLDKDKDADRAKKKGGFNWMGIVMIGVGAAGGALAGFLIGGPIGAVVGAVLGGLLGWLAPKLLH